MSSKKHLVVDGSNIATEGRTLPSLAQLDEAVRAFIAERPHDIYTVVVDATFEHRIDTSERKLYDEALAANELIVTPAGTVGRGDRFILEVADRAEATVLSNDSFQEFHGDYAWLFDSGRLIGGRPVPGVGWIFVERTPVRGPKSRQATRAAAQKRGGAASGRGAGRGAATSRAASEPMPVPASPPPSPRRARGSKAPATKAAAAKAPAGRASAAKAPAAKSPAREPRGRARKAAVEQVPTEPSPAGGGRRRPQQPLNDQLPFIEFIAEHLPGSTVEGEVVEFSSHGAYVQVGDVRCYIALKFMGEPAPRSARDVLERGVARSFVVQSIEAARRGIDLALPGFEKVAGQSPAPVADDAPARPARRRSRAKADETLPVAASVDAAPAVDKAPAEAGAKQPESEATLAATKKAAARKTAAKKRPAKKAAAKKTTARKSTARKATAKRAPAKKATARKSTARKTVAKKRPAKKAAAKKTTARKSTAKKTTARKTAAKKRPAKKAAAKKTTARKTTAKKRPAKKAAAKKRPAKKAAAKKRPAKKAAARKTTARKTTARKTTARKTAARKR